MNKNSDPVQKCFLKGGWATVPQLKFCQTSGIVEMSQARKLIFGLQVTIDKTNSGRYYVTR